MPYRKQLCGGCIPSQRWSRASMQHLSRNSFESLFTAFVATSVPQYHNSALQLSRSQYCTPQSSIRYSQYRTPRSASRGITTTCNSLGRSPLVQPIAHVGSRALLPPGSSMRVCQYLVQTVLTL
eukprot:2984829-Rhodomonas_salina.4